MIKRPFYLLKKPRLYYDLLEKNPKEPQSMPVPSSLILLLKEPIDGAKQALIKKGDIVEKGDRLSLYKESEEYAISPVAGTIDNIDTYLDAFGNTYTSFVIKNDPEKTRNSELEELDLKDDIASADQYLRQLPGAPPLKALASDDIKINKIVITCADMDLLSTTSQYVAFKFLDEIKQGVQILQKITNVSEICAVVPEGLGLQDKLGSVKIFETDLEYPSSLPEMILKNHFNRVLPAGKTPEDLGVAFITAEAVKSLAQAYSTKTQAFEKIVTIIGRQGYPYRVKATIGTPLQDILRKFSIHMNEQDRIIIGGPMKGFATFTQYHPVQADMDTVLIQDNSIIAQVSDNSCVNCGKCIRICPVNVPVNILVRYLEADQYEAASDKYDLESCIECGLCAYVCTARIPLYQHIRLGKHELLKLRALP